MAYFEEEKKKADVKGYIEISEISSIQNVESNRFTIVTTTREYELEAGSSQ